MEAEEINALSRTEAPSRSFLHDHLPGTALSPAIANRHSLQRSHIAAR